MLYLEGGRYHKGWWWWWWWGEQPSEPAHPGNLSLSDITGIFKPQLGLTRSSIKVNSFQTSKSVDVLIVDRTF